MRATEFINESITFGVTVQQKYTDKQGQEKFYWSNISKEEELPCWLCKGTGKDKYDEKNTCEVCNGTGKTIEEVSTTPELNVSNTNGFAIQQMLGLNPDYAGVILNKDLPELIRKLINLKNRSLQNYTQKPTSKYGEMVRVKDPNTGITRIQRSATVHDMGRSHEQVALYIDRLLEIAKFAQQNNASLGWS